MRYYRYKPTGDLFYCLVDRLEIDADKVDNLICDKENTCFLITEVVKWCNDEFGDDWDWAVANNKLTMYFKNREDAMKFKLMWS